MTDRSIDAEIEANEQRGLKAKDAHHHASIIDAVEDAFGIVTKPLADDRPTEQDRKEQREENDADQR